jgi:hypothetical protein
MNAEEIEKLDQRIRVVAAAPDIGLLEATRWFEGWRVVVFGGAVALFLRWRPRGLLDEAVMHAAARWLRLHSPLPHDIAERNRHAHP